MSPHGTTGRFYRSRQLAPSMCGLEDVSSSSIIGHWLKISKAMESAALERPSAAEAARLLCRRSGLDSSDRMALLNSSG
ncbi:hypothetical protein D3C84_1052640 [compost metagenome]